MELGDAHSEKTPVKKSDKDTSKDVNE